ncbi:hypothetical protein HYS94_01560 [Candidatus Daviesbacteria bacterium]|nr:hypothetical protein [Candidatus Daviesbacteria bacterium]
MPATFQYSTSLGGVWTTENNLVRATIKDTLGLPMSINVTLANPLNARERTYTEYIRVRFIDDINTNQIIFLGKADMIQPFYDDIYGQVLTLSGKDNFQSLLKQFINTNYTGFVQRSALIEQIVLDHRITGSTDTISIPTSAALFEDSVVVEPAGQLETNYLNSRKPVLMAIAELALEDPWDATPTGFGYDYFLTPEMYGNTPSPDMHYFIRGARPVGGASGNGLTVQFNTTETSQRLQMLPDYEFPKAAVDIRTICRIEYVDASGANQSLRVELIEVSGGAGTFTLGETITGGASGVTAVVQFTGATTSFITVSTWSGNFTVGETITGGTSGATRVIDRVPRQAFNINTELIITGYHVAQIAEARDKAASLLFKSTNLSTRSITRGKFRVIGWPRYTRTNAAIDKAESEDSGVFVNETAAANNAAANDMTLLPPAGSAGVNDGYNFGSNEKFNTLTLNVGTAGVGTWTITWEYSTGGTWAALSGVVDGTNGFHNAGSNTITFTVPNDWSKGTSGLDTLFLVRARISAFTNMVTQPLGTQVFQTYNHLVRAGELVRVINSNVPIGSGVATLNEDMLVTSIVYDYGPGVHYSIIEVVETDRGLSYSKSIIKKMDEEIDDSQFASIGAAGGLAEASMTANLNFAFTVVDNNDITWPLGTITWADGSSQSILAGSLNWAGTRYLYVIAGNTTLQNTATFSDTIGANRTLVAIAVSTAAGLNADLVSLNHGTPFIAGTRIISNQLSALSADMGLLTAGEVRVGSGAIGVDFAGFRIYPTAIEGYENIGGVSTLHVQISSTDGKLRLIGTAANAGLEFHSPLNTIISSFYATATDMNIAASNNFNLRLIVSGTGEILTGLAGAGSTNIGNATYYFGNIYGTDLYVQEIRRRSGAGGDIGSGTNYFNTIWLGLQNRITSSSGDLLFQVANTAQNGQVTGSLIQDGDNPVVQIGSAAYFDFNSRPHRNLRTRTSPPTIDNLEIGELVLGDLGNTATDGRIWIKPNSGEIFEFTSTAIIT